ncbi:hypothetical protein [Mesomycoplasma ovipneumoniae]|uniref:hypothetical protein n=1 Tax=Mesomycoplasma ovipneumoniae TaxID=29562 RepID=UPI0030804A11
MIDIIELEIKNLSNEEKESLYDKMKNEWPQRINPNENWEKFKDYQKLDKALKYYFWEHPSYLFLSNLIIQKVFITKQLKKIILRLWV